MGGKPSLHPDLDPGELAPNNSEQLLSQSANGSKTMSTETSDEQQKDIELEEKEVGFIGPRLPRMLTDDEVKVLLDE